jgi:hypothetical protein
LPRDVDQGFPIEVSFNSGSGVSWSQASLTKSIELQLEF